MGRGGNYLLEWFVASIGVGELGRNGIFKNNIFLCVHLHFAELNAHTSVHESSPKCD